MNESTRVARRSHGTGRWRPEDFARWGDGAVLEEDVLVFHAENIEVGMDVYVGHLVVLKGYHRNQMVIGDGTWIGEQSYMNSAGGLVIGRNVGIAPGVRIITSRHAEDGRARPILHSPLEFRPVAIEDDADVGVGAIVLPGVTIGRGAQVGAGAVVASDVAAYSVVAGVPARVLRFRPA